MAKKATKKDLKNACYNILYGWYRYGLNHETSQRYVNYLFELLKKDDPERFFYYIDLAKRDEERENQNG